MDWKEYLSNASYKADNEARKEFGSNLMLAFKQKNISESCQWYNAAWLHSRVREWKVTFPPALGSAVVFVDVQNMIMSGDIETACLSLIYGESDDMTSPLHWVSDERRQWLIDQMKAWLGWP